MNKAFIDAARRAIGNTTPIVPLPASIVPLPTPSVIPVIPLPASIVPLPTPSVIDRKDIIKPPMSKEDRDLWEKNFNVKNFNVFSKEGLWEKREKREKNFNIIFSKYNF